MRHVCGTQWACALGQREYKRFTEFAEVLGGIDRVLLFIHPDKVVESPTIQEVQELAGLLEDQEGVGQNDAEGGEAGGQATPADWDAADVSTQVKLVELLQIAISLSKGLKKLAVVVSAWDRVEALNLTPKEWLDQRLPLLSQYLSSHVEATPFRVFGVSALGGDIIADKTELAQKTNQADRIKVSGLDAGYGVHDVTFPVRWLFS